MNCCSIVEAPWMVPLCRMSWVKARAMPRMSMPLLVSKRLSSIEITASLTIWGISEGVTITRFCWLTTPIGWPRSSSRTELCASFSCENLVSDGRSEATATNMPNTKEIRPSSRTARRISRKRSLFKRGRPPAGSAADSTEGESLALASDAERHLRPRRGSRSARAKRRRQPARRCARRQAADGAGGGPPAARQAGYRSDGAGHPPRSRGRPSQAARVPGRRSPGGADRRRLHRSRGRPLGPLEPAPDALRGGNRGQRRDLPGAGLADPRPRSRAPGGAAQRRVAGHGAHGAARTGAHHDRRAAARARRLRQALLRVGADLDARAALPAAPGL